MAELRVGIKADVTGAKRLVRALKDIRAAAAGTSTSLETTTAAASGTSIALSTTVSASGALASSQNLASIANASVSKTLASVAARAAETAGAEAGTTTQTNRLTAAFLRLQAAASASLARTAASAGTIATQMKTAAGSLVGMSTAVVGVGAAIAIAVGVGVKQAKEFESTFAKIQGLVGLTATEVEELKGPMEDIGRAVGKGPNELAEALFFITSAGARGKQALDILEVSAKAAAAGLGETKQVADAVTSAINAYGAENLSAAQATDILVATVREGKAEADSIAGALGQILPAASELGVKFSELGGTIAALTRIGLGADQGATALGATLAAIQKPGQDAKKALEEFGTSASELRAKVKNEGLLVALQDLQERFGDNEEALTRVFPNIRALRAILPLVGKNAGDVGKIFESVANSTGSLDTAMSIVAETTGQKMDVALTAMLFSLKSIGETFLPLVTVVAQAAAIVLKGLEIVVVAIGDAFSFAGKSAKLFGESIAEALIGSDDPIIRNLNNIRELDDELKRLEGGGSLRKFFTSVGGIDLTGDRKQQLEQLREALSLQRIAERQNDREELARQRIALALKNQASAIEEVVEATKEIAFDQELFDSGLKSLTKLKDEVSFLALDLTHLQELGQEGIGLAEDLTETGKILSALQGRTDATAESIRRLVNEKRLLKEKIDAIAEAFQKQEAAVEFLDDLRKSTADVAEAFAFVRAGGALIDIEATQQARQILADLGEGTTETLETITASIIASRAWADALGSIPVNKVDALKTQLKAIQDLQAAEDPESSAFAVMGGQIDALGQSLIDATLQSAGLGTAAELMFDALPKAEQFAQRRQEIKDAFDLAGIVDPESNPQFIAAIEALQKKMFDTTDMFKEFAIQAARNVQSAFADFLFDPFSNGLDGLLADFTETLKRMASELLSQQLLKSFFSAIGGGGGGILDTIAGQFAEGGNVQAGKPILVGEKGPEIITPRQSGTVIPNDMLGGKQQAPQVSVGGPTIVNTIDDAAIVGAFNRGGGNSVVLNNMTENQSSYRNALGIQ